MSASDGATKFDDGKVRWDLVPYKELENVAKVMTFGANKYADNGWKGVDKQRYIAALMRHFVAYMGGELIDPESGLPHMSHLRCNALFIEWKDNNEDKVQEVETCGKATDVQDEAGSLHGRLCGDGELRLRPALSGGDESNSSWLLGSDSKRVRTTD